MGKIKQWIVAHKLWSIVIASVLVVGITLSIALPLALRKCNHEYDHACDPTCNICGETRTIDVVEMEDWYGSTSFKSKTVLSGEAGAQHVVKVPFKGGLEIRLYLPDAEGHIDNDQLWLVENYDIRIFDEEFNELNVEFGADGETLAYVEIHDAEDNDISESWVDKNVYFMFTIKTAGDNFIITIQ